MTTQRLDKEGINGIRLAFIGIYLVIIVVSALWQTPFMMQISPIISVLAIFTVVCLHGTMRYGIKNMKIFFN